MQKTKTNKESIPSWEEIKKMFAEISKQFAETDKKIAETDRIVKETSKSIKELSKNIGGISNSNGNVAEEIIFASLEENMTFAGVKFDDIIQNLHKHKKKFNIEGEYDIILKNGDTLAIIESKYNVKAEHIEEIANKQVEKFRKLFDEYAKYNIILGIAGLSFDKKALQKARDYGIGVIKVKLKSNKVEYHTDNIKTYYAEN